jgi:hypothetical protein
MPDVQVFKDWQGEKEHFASKWWTEDDAKVHESVIAIAKKILQNQNYRQEENIKHLRLYANKELMGIHAGLFNQIRQTPRSDDHRLTLNVVRSCIDTAVSKIGKSKPRSMFLTTDGDWAQRRKAKQTTLFFDGWFHESSAYEYGRMAFRDGCVFGTGAVKIFRTGEGKDQKIACERVLMDEIIVDDIEGMYGTPQNLYQRKYIPRTVLFDMFPDAKFARAIESAPSGISRAAYVNAVSDMVEVWEAWHLPSSKGSKDGRHVIVIEGATLFSEPYKKLYFPFVFFRWSPRLVGFYGSGLAEELTGIQIEINHMLITIQRAQRLMCNPQVWLDVQNKQNKHTMTNLIGGINYYSGSPPVYVSPPAMPAEFYAHLQDLYRKAFEITGTSMMSATSRKPAGLDAAVALREYQDIESERFMSVSMAYEKFYLDLTEIVYDEFEEMYEEGIDVTVKSAGKKSFTGLKWSDVRMPRDSYTIRVFPVSLLPTTPSGRLQRVQELIQAGMMTREEGLAQLDFPDTEHWVSRATAHVSVIEKYIDRMLDGEPMVPEPFMNLRLAQTMVQNAYLQAIADDAPDEVIDILQSFMDQVDAMLAAKEQTQATAATQQADLTQNTPLAVPESLPVSDLLPMEGAVQ